MIAKKLLLTIFLSSLLSFSIQAQSSQDFIRAGGSALVHGTNNDTIYLQGINFNNFWLDDGSPNWIFDDPNDTGTPQPYAFGDLNWFIDAKQIGFNVIRVMLNYRIFEDNGNPFVYKPSGWAFLDQYIQWADSLGMYLILDMHVPQGGLQNGSNAPKLWMNMTQQNRLTALWFNIAQRYSNDTIIAGFDLLNEPTPVDSIAPWSTLAQRIADTIRTVDSNHLLIVEYAYGIIDTSNTWYPYWDLSQQMFLISDINVMYDFHYYNPLAYTLQCYNNPGCTPTIQYNDTSVVFTTESGNSLPFDQDWLVDDLAGMMAVYKTANVPINIGEWAPWRANYEYNNDQMQGFEYICDLLDLFALNKMNWQYYCYSEFRHTTKDPNGNDSLNILLSNYFQYGGCFSDTGATPVIEGSSFLNKVTIFPNPSKGIVTIDLGTLEDVSIRVFNVIGELIYQKENISNSLHQMKLDEVPGIYFVEVRAQGVQQHCKILLE